MQFLSLTTAAIAATLTIPPLVALYFLKLKRTVRVVPSTLLWKKAIEDLHVNSPFQRLRSSLLLLLQLLVLALAAIALGKPMLQTTQRHEEALVLLIDQSASMGVLEEDGRTRLEAAKEKAKKVIQNMADDAQAMIIAFCDRATVVSSFDSDRNALARKVDSIEPTQSSSLLSEAISLAEAYAQNQVIGGDEFGSDIAPEAPAPKATVFLFTDGRVQDEDKVAIRKFDVERMNVVSVGARSDNVGIVSMDARRRYEQPEVLEVTATVRNFQAAPVKVDVVLYVDRRTVDIQTVRLDPAGPVPTGEGEVREGVPGGVEVVAFDPIEFGGSGVVEVFLRIDDALAADNRAWSVISPPQRAKVLLVSDGNPIFRPLLGTLQALPLDLTVMTTGQYESADEEDVALGRRSAFDVVIFNQHSTARLPQGNYLFFGGIPQIEGVSTEGVINDEMIFNWDETHPVLRHVAVETVEIFEWLRLKLPPEAISLIDGATSPVLAYLARDASQYMIAAFALILRDDEGFYRYNTYWVNNPDFIVFVYNAVQFLASNVTTTGTKGAAPGDPVTIPVPPDAGSVTVLGPDGVRDELAAQKRQTVHYANTRTAGIYEVQPAVPGGELFAVNLFNPVESHIEPVKTLTLGAGQLSAQAGPVEVSRPAWQYFLFALLLLLLLEWIVYNQRVFV